mmetsp:Transcript_28812/g.67050  ORF Transcript_28812/g.67050 Transcript_28812/m.67050 type:complete len:120 (+) Transcript_28812:1506-1865(+)
MSGHGGFQLLAEGRPWLVLAADRVESMLRPPSRQPPACCEWAPRFDPTPRPQTKKEGPLPLVQLSYVLSGLEGCLPPREEDGEDSLMLPRPGGGGVPADHTSTDGRRDGEGAPGRVIVL